MQTGGGPDHPGRRMEDLRTTVPGHNSDTRPIGSRPVGGGCPAPANEAPPAAGPMFAKPRRNWSTRRHSCGCHTAEQELDGRAASPSPTGGNASCRAGVQRDAKSRTHFMSVDRCDHLPHLSAVDLRVKAAMIWHRCRSVATRKPVSGGTGRATNETSVVSKLCLKAKPMVPRDGAAGSFSRVG